MSPRQNLPSPSSWFSCLHSMSPNPQGDLPWAPSLNNSTSRMIPQRTLKLIQPLHRFAPQKMYPPCRTLRLRRNQDPNVLQWTPSFYTQYHISCFLRLVYMLYVIFRLSQFWEKCLRMVTGFPPEGISLYSSSTSPAYLEFLLNSLKLWEPVQIYPVLDAQHWI